MEAQVPSRDWGGGWGCGGLESGWVGVVLGGRRAAVHGGICGAGAGVGERGGRLRGGEGAGRWCTQRAWHLIRNEPCEAECWFEGLPAGRDSQNRRRLLELTMETWQHASTLQEESPEEGIFLARNASA